MADKLRVGIIGANPEIGWASRTHMPALQAGIPGLELVAVCTTRQESADAAAKQFGAQHAYADHREMLRSADIDIAAVVVKLPSHYELTKDIIEAGKHVYTEWPLGTNTAQAEELAKLAKQKGVRTAVGLQARRGADLMQIRKLIADGYVGDVIAVNMTQFSGGGRGRPVARTWMKDVEVGANTHTIAFGHAFDGVMTAVGRPATLSGVVSTQIKEWTASDTGEKFAVTAPDQTLLSGILQNGAVLSVHVGSMSRGTSGHRLEVHGTEGVLMLDAPGSPHGNSPTRLRGYRGDQKEAEDIPVSEDAWVGDAELSGGAINVGKMWKSFAEAIADGSDFDPDFDSAVTHHKLMDAIMKASDTGQAQKV